MTILEGEQRLLLAPDARASLLGLKIINYALPGFGLAAVAGLLLFHSYLPDWAKTPKVVIWVGVGGWFSGCAPTLLGTQRAQRRAEETIRLEQLAASSAAASATESYYGKLAWGAKPGINQGSEEESKVGILPTGYSEPENLAREIITYLGESFGVTVNYQGYSEMPRVWSIELKKGNGVKIKQLNGFAEDIQTELGIKTKPVFMVSNRFVSCQIPKSKPSPIRFSEHIPEKAPGEGILIPIGLDENWNLITVNLLGSESFSGLISGRSGSGKTIEVMQILAGLIRWYEPSQVQLCLCDLKGADYALFEGSPHLWSPLATEELDVLQTLCKLSAEMKRRNELFKNHGVRNLQQFNQKYPDQRMPIIFTALDEISVLVNEDAKEDIAKEVTKQVKTLSKLGRSAGICVWVITQKPITTEIPSVILSNLNVRVGLKVNTSIESKVAIKEPNYCNKLLGKGDGYLNDERGITRFQSTFITDEELERIIWEHSGGQRPGGFSNDNWSPRNVSENNPQNPCYTKAGGEAGEENGEEMLTIDVEVVPDSPPEQPPTWEEWLRALYCMDIEGRLFVDRGLRGGDLPFPGKCPKVCESVSFEAFVGREDLLPLRLRDLIVSANQKRVPKDEAIKLLFGISRSGKGKGKAVATIYKNILKKYG